MKNNKSFIDKLSNALYEGIDNVLSFLETFFKTIYVYKYLIFFLLSFIYFFYDMWFPSKQEQLRDAACRGEFETVKKLVNEGVNANSETINQTGEYTFEKETILTYAIKCEKVSSEIVDFLIEHGARITSKDGKNRIKN